MKRNKWNSIERVKCRTTTSDNVLRGTIHKGERIDKSYSVGVNPNHVNYVIQRKFVFFFCAIHCGRRSWLSLSRNCHQFESITTYKHLLLCHNMVGSWLPEPIPAPNCKIRSRKKYHLYFCSVCILVDLLNYRTPALFAHITQSKENSNTFSVSRLRKTLSRGKCTADVKMKSYKRLLDLLMDSAKRCQRRRPLV